MTTTTLSRADTRSSLWRSLRIGLFCLVLFAVGFNLDLLWTLWHSRFANLPFTPALISGILGIGLWLHQEHKKAPAIIPAGSQFGWVGWCLLSIPLGLMLDKSPLFWIGSGLCLLVLMIGIRAIRIEKVNIAIPLLILAIAVIFSQGEIFSRAYLDPFIGPCHVGSRLRALGCVHSAARDENTTSLAFFSTETGRGKLIRTENGVVWSEPLSHWRNLDQLQALAEPSAEFVQLEPLPNAQMLIRSLRWSVARAANPFPGFQETGRIVLDIESGTIGAQNQLEGYAPAEQERILAAQQEMASQQQGVRSDRWLARRTSNGSLQIWALDAPAPSPIERVALIPPAADLERQPDWTVYPARTLTCLLITLDERHLLTYAGGGRGKLYVYDLEERTEEVYDVPPDLRCGLTATQEQIVLFSEGTQPTLTIVDFARGRVLETGPLNLDSWGGVEIVLALAALSPNGRYLTLDTVETRFRSTRGTLVIDLDKLRAATGFDG